MNERPKPKREFHVILVHDLVNTLVPIAVDVNDFSAGVQRFAPLKPAFLALSALAPAKCVRRALIIATRNLFLSAVREKFAHCCVNLIDTDGKTRSVYGKRGVTDAFERVWADSYVVIVIK